MPLPRLPGEWEPHSATWITWPCRMSVWNSPPARYADTCRAYANVINAIAPCERVYCIINPEHLAIAQALCTRENVMFIDSMGADDSWSRDTSPIFLTQQEQLIATCWQFNAWGEKFSPYDRDAQLAEKISHYLASKNTPIEIQKIPMILEGGSIHSNGQGILMTTKECLLHANRNPNLSQDDIEAQLKKAFYSEHIIWLNRGLDGDVDTDGHIDNAACFANEHEIIIQSCDDANDPNYAYFQENKKILTQDNAHKFTIHEIPQPPRTYINDARVPLSYINFYYINEAIILPTFDSPKTDDIAKQLFCDIFPHRTILTVPAWPILHGGGGIHCITMQQPKV